VPPLAGPCTVLDPVLDPPAEGGPVLAAANRLRTRTEFTDVVRRGRRAARPLLTLHLLPPASPVAATDPARAGLVVSKAVGGSVVRHQVSRRLRHVLRGVVGTLPAGTRLVVRAAPAAAAADSRALSADLIRALDRLAGR
jgi:ribonuclease P protein component